MAKSGLAARLLLSGFSLAYLAATWGSGFDRLSAETPTLERLVPGVFRAQADLSAGAVALARGDKANALAFGESAVRNDPLRPQATALLGIAHSFAEDQQDAEDAFRVSAQRGWRDRLTQIYWYDAAMRANDIERAALRADALLRANPNLEGAAKLVAPLEATPEGRLALAHRLAEAPPWSAGYFRAGQTPDVTRLKNRAQVALAAVGQGNALECDTLGGFARELLLNGMRRDAENLWRASCGKAGAAPARGMLADGNFELLSKSTQQAPFGWRKFASGDLAVDMVELAPNAHAVRARSTASVTRLILSQAVDIPPGSWRVKARGSVPAERLVISLDCDGHARRPSRINGDAAAAGQVLEADACERAILGVWLRPGRDEVTLEEMTIEPAE